MSPLGKIICTNVTCWIVIWPIKLIECSEMLRETSVICSIVTETNKIFQRHKQDKQYTYKRNIETRWRNHFCRGRAIGRYYIFWVCVCGLSFPARSALAPYRIVSVACLSVPYFATLSIHGTIFGQKKIIWLKIKCVFWFCLQVLSETLFILKIIQRDIINVLGIYVNFPLLLPDCNETWIFLTDFRKIIEYKIS